MLQDKMNNVTKVILIAVLVVAAICIVPMIIVWTINSVAEAGGSEFYLDHSLWNYFLCILLVAIFRGSKLG